MTVEKAREIETRLIDTIVTVGRVSGTPPRQIRMHPKLLEALLALNCNFATEMKPGAPAMFHNLPIVEDRELKEDIAQVE